MTGIVAVFEAARLMVSEKKTKMQLRTSEQTSLAPPLVIEAAGQRYRETTLGDINYPRKHQ